MKIKSLLYILPIVSVFALVGCGDKDQKSKEQNKVVSNNSTPQIEVVQNNNAHAIKVKEKKKTKIQVKNGKAYYYDYNINSEYDQNAQPANKDASVRMKPRTVLDANMHIRSPYERVQISLIMKQLSKDFKLKCSACHDDYANGVIGPSLLGKKDSYIYDKIIAFKTGKASNPLMDGLINKMSNDEIKIISKEIYEFNKQIQKIRGK
jgi:cytochrome c553